MIKYQAKIIKDSGSFSVEFPDLPGCFSFGETLEEAKKMIKNFRRELSSFLESEGNHEQVYSLNIQLFPQSHEVDKCDF